MTSAGYALLENVQKTTDDSIVRIFRQSKLIETRQTKCLWP